ncbi:MAG: hypothetical protein AAF236_00170 [Verrucomicrobiota bacterium]
MFLLAAPALAIDFDFPKDTSFAPENWLEDPIAINITPIAAEDKTPASDIISKAILKYPDDFLETRLSRILVVAKLECYGAAFGGTYLANNRAIVITYRGAMNKASFEGRIHHEISSLMLESNRDLFHVERWQRALPVDFAYDTDKVIEQSATSATAGVEKLQSTESPQSLLTGTTDLRKLGFLNRYSTTSIEQDFNEVAAALFTDKQIWMHAAGSANLAQKVDVLIDFYRAVDPRFDRIFFHRLTQPLPKQ